MKIFKIFRVSHLIHTSIRVLSTKIRIFFSNVHGFKLNPSLGRKKIVQYNKFKNKERPEN